MIDYSEEDDLADIEWGGNYEAHISDDGEAWCVVNVEAGDEVERCGSKAEAVERAKARNREDKPNG